MKTFCEDRLLDVLSKLEFDFDLSFGWIKSKILTLNF